jgi:hypothetical protein
MSDAHGRVLIGYFPMPWFAASGLALRTKAIVLLLGLKALGFACAATLTTP